ARQLQLPLRCNKHLYPPLIGRKLVKLLDYNPSYCSKVLLNPLPDQYGLESLRRGNQHVWRALGLSRPSTRWRGPVTHLDLHIKVPSHLFQTSQQVPVQRAERRNVENRDPMNLLGRTSLEKPVQDRQDSCQRLSRSRWSDEENVLAP